MNAVISNTEPKPIRDLARGAYDIQSLRIQMGNRITSNFKTKLGMKTDGMSEAELGKAERKILDTLRESYIRITDGVVAEGDIVIGKLPTLKKFKGDAVISTYTELVLVDQYMGLLTNEQGHFKRLGMVLKDYPIYTEFLEKVKGCGPAISAVIISEIDIAKAEYPSSLWMYAGLDTVTYGTYVDDQGKEHKIRPAEIDMYYETNDPEQPMLAQGKYPVKLTNEGRSRKDYCLVKREYEAKDGTVKERDSITFNPFLKTKLIGVMGGAFLKTGGMKVDGDRMSTAKRLELAIKEGYDPKGNPEAASKEDVLEYLKQHGHTVEKVPSKYADIYYDYKNRIENMPRHAEKTKLHIHNMAIRYIVKRFLVDLYIAWRTLEGLPVALEYSEAVLGMHHGKAGYGKPTL